MPQKRLISTILTLILLASMPMTIYARNTDTTKISQYPDEKSNGNNSEVYVYFVSYGSPVTPIALKKGVSLDETGHSKLPKPTRTNYAFKYWTDTPDEDSAEYDTSTPLHNNLILYASWTGLNTPYKIVYWLEVADFGADNTPEPGNALHYDYAGESTGTAPAGSTETINSIPDYNNYPNDNAMRYARFQSSAPTMISGNGETIINVYATRKSYTLTFDLTDTGYSMIIGGEQYTGSQYKLHVKYEQDLTLTWPTNPNAAFSGFRNDAFYAWKPSGANTTLAWASRRIEMTSEMMPSNPVTSGYTLIAKADAKNSTDVRYWIEPYPGQTGETTRKYKNKTYILDTSYNQSDLPSIISAKELHGFTRAGTDWSNSETDPDSGTRGQYKNFYFNRNTYKFTYNTVGGSAITATSLMYGQPLEARGMVKSPVKQGHNFLGWYKDADCLKPFDFTTTMPGKNVAIFAKWEATAICVCFFDEAGNPLMNANGEQYKQGLKKGGAVNFNYLLINGILYDNNLTIEGKGQFAGWEYYPPNIPVRIHFPPDLQIFEDTNLYIRWQADETTEEEGSGSGVTDDSSSGSDDTDESDSGTGDADEGGTGSSDTDDGSAGSGVIDESGGGSSSNSGTDESNAGKPSNSSSNEDSTGNGNQKESNTGNSGSSENNADNGGTDETSIGNAGNDDPEEGNAGNDDPEEGNTGADNADKNHTDSGTHNTYPLDTPDEVPFIIDPPASTPPSTPPSTNRPSNNRLTTIQDNNPAIIDIPDEKAPLAAFREMDDHRIYIHGYPDKTVKPDNPITRAEAATIFYRLLSDSHKRINTVSTFKDVSPKAWYFQAITTLADQGIITGYADVTFRPDKPITRAEIAAITARLDNLTLITGTAFNDIPSNHWATGYIHSARTKGWVNGYDDGTFRPNQYITRAEAAKIINKMFERLPDNIPENIRNPYIDIDNSHWAYNHIMEASTNHMHRRDDTGTDI